MQSWVLCTPARLESDKGRQACGPTCHSNLAGSLDGNDPCFPAKPNPQVEKEKNLLVAAKRQAAEAAEAARQAELALRGQAVSVWWCSQACCMVVLVPLVPEHASQAPEGLQRQHAGWARSTQLVPMPLLPNLRTLCPFMCPQTAGPGHAEEPPGTGSHQRLDPGRHHRGHQGQEVG